MKPIIYILTLISFLSCNLKEKATIVNEKKVINDSLIKVIEKYYQDNYGEGSKLLKKVTDSIIEISYQNIPENKDDYVGKQMGVRIPKQGKNIFYGDLNNDKLEDIIVSVYTEGGGAGGNVWWDDIFLFLKKEDKYLLTTVKTNWEISGCDNGFIFIKEIENNLIKGTSSCYSDDDGRCCPSLTYNIQLQVVNNKIVTKSRKKIEKNR